ncbi:large subunit ribosomal protein L18 [Natronospira proteinivora]|uniref:Large ribosomal subunit protein uL18 n=1 Tax=Natronospira proteinivora TaxID=1807133 RepID=A0ABT1GB60_9GAMM|nr:50S ribosomal protein L18 [Natronospira proteinivora]MCP1728521.1 large subunit ribosomal protein L18 [Natronospira proteinivora]
MDKRTARTRRARKARANIRQIGAHRLSVHRTPRHIYAQVIAPDGGKVLAAASTVQPELKKSLKGTGNVTAAEAVGKAIAEKAKAAGIEQVAFDRSGFRYHGRVKALADAARESGLKF